MVRMVCIKIKNKKQTFYFLKTIAMKKENLEQVLGMVELYPNFKECAFQTFDDTKSWKPLARIMNYHEWIRDELEQMNNEWAWIYFSVNSMEKWKRDKNSVKWINAWICEIDDLDKELQRKLINVAPLQPSLIIESKKSLHMYWYAKDWTKENWEKICWWLRNFFDGDRAVVDISRVLRVAWYNHMKNPSEPFMCKVVWWNSKLYTESEMLSSYTDTESYAEKKERTMKAEMEIKKHIDNDDFWDRVRAMDTKTILSQISWTSMVCYEDISFKRNSNWTEQIYVNWKSTWSWLDTNWKIGSTSNWWPNWTNWVFWYGKVDGKELYQWIKKEYPMMIPEKKVEKKSEKKVDTQVVNEEYEEFDMWEITPFTRWLKSLDEKLGRIDYHKFLLAMWESGSWKTEFTFFQARKNADMWNKVCYIWLEMTKKNMIARICMKRAKVSKEQWDNKTFTESQRDFMRDEYKRLWDYKNLDIEHIENATLDSIKEMIINKMNEWYTLFYIDNLWFITWDDDELTITKNASRELKELTNSNKISIVLLHHFNKWNSQERALPRWLSSIRSSWKLENDADYVFQVWRDLSEWWDNTTTILLQKDRVWGTPNSIDILFDRWDYIDK